MKKLLTLSLVAIAAATLVGCSKAPSTEEVLPTAEEAVVAPATPELAPTTGTAEVSTAAVAAPAAEIATGK